MPANVLEENSMQMDQRKKRQSNNQSNFLQWSKWQQTLQGPLEDTEESPGNEKRSRCSLSYCSNTVNDEAEVTCTGSVFQMRAPASGKARQPMVVSGTAGTIRSSEVENRSLRRRRLYFHFVVRKIMQKKTTRPIFTKFGEKVAHGTRKNSLDFDGNQDDYVTLGSGRFRPQCKQQNSGTTPTDCFTSASRLPCFYIVH